MLLKQFKEVSEIDARINKIHGELADLYRQRSAIALPSQLNSTVNASAPLAAMVEAEYTRLKLIWQKYGVALPALKSLRPKLVKAHKLIEKINTSELDLSNKLEIVLVPPTKKLPFPVPANMRQYQPFVPAADYVSSDIQTPIESKKWRVLVVYKEKEGLYLGTAQMILSEKNHTLANHNSAALGLIEYVAFSLQQAEPFDTQVWTLLLKDYDQANNIVPCVTYSDGRFRFMLDAPDNVFGDNRFRPAIEV